MQKRLLGGVTLVVATTTMLVALAVPAAARTKPSPTSTASSCTIVRDDAWPDWVEGRPAGLDAGDTGGVYLWHDADGFHVRVTHKSDDRVVFGGELSTRGQFADVTGVALEGADRFQVTRQGHAIVFEFRNYGHMDGLDFHTRCAPNLTMTFRADGHLLAGSRIVIGHEDRHATSDPFTILRTV